MTESANPQQEIKDLILALDRKFETQLAALDRKLDVQLAALDKKLDVQLGALDKKIDIQFLEVRSEIKEVRSAVKEVEIKLKEEIRRIEEKLSEKMDGLGKRLDQQEFISRGAIVTLVAGITTGFIKYLFFLIPDFSLLASCITAWISMVDQREVYTKGY
jgi:hypothetical protein